SRRQARAVRGDRPVTRIVDDQRGADADVAPMPTRPSDQPAVPAATAVAALVMHVDARGLVAVGGDGSGPFEQETRAAAPGAAVVAAGGEASARAGATNAGDRIERDP